MKKILFLLLFPCLCFADFFEGTIKFTNGSTQSGLVEFPEIMDSSIKFKPTKKDKPQKFTIDEIDGIDFTLEDGRSIHVVATKYFESTFKGKVKGVSDRKIWVQQYYDGIIKMYYGFQTLTYATMSPNGFSRSYVETAFYLKSPSKEYPQLVFKHYPKGIGVFNLFKTQITKYFEEDCPALVASLDKSIIKESKYYLIGEFYDNNCGK